MAQYIDKGPLVEKIKHHLRFTPEHTNAFIEGEEHAYKTILSFINSQETKEVDTWHLQEKENIYDAVKDWSLHTFVCIMKDGTIQRFTGNMDEDCEGHINVHVNGVNDDYDDVDDIVKWTELT